LNYGGDVTDAGLIHADDLHQTLDDEPELEELSTLRRALLDTVPDAMVVVNQSGAIVLANLQAGHEFGYDPAELVGQSIQHIIPTGWARPLADSRSWWEEALAQPPGTAMTLTGHRKDGTDFPIEAIPNPLAGADVRLVAIAIRRMTVRQAAEHRLLVMEARYRWLLEAAPDAMVVVNPRNDVILLNRQAERQFGYARNELIGQPVQRIIPEGFAERLLADGRRPVEEALAQQIGMGVELTGRRKNHTTFPIEIMLSPHDSADGILMTVAIRDITVRKTAEQDLLRKVDELSRSNNDLRQFAYVASHDLQEPLRTVSSFTQLLARRYKGQLDAQADEFIAFAVDGANRMQRLIQDLLAYSRVGTEGQDLRETSSDEALDHALLNLRAAIEESGARVTHAPLPTVLADERQLIQLFQNLVGNAVKYRGAAAPQVHIAATKENTTWIFTVTDNGLGIDAEYFDRIFGMFQRLHTRETFSGTGMGLAICKKIVERHHGRIWVESTIGQGSTFYFVLTESERTS
jgi:PAS domain S-box-containing protein